MCLGNSQDNGSKGQEGSQFVLKSCLKTSSLKRPSDGGKCIDRCGMGVTGCAVELEELRRRDSQGTEIKNGKHKIMFRDKVKPEERVYDVILVESYKKYNASEDTEESIICKCSIF